MFTSTQISAMPPEKGGLPMPAWITEKGYIRVTFPGFDKVLTNWRGHKLKDFPVGDVEKLCEFLNTSILMGNIDAVKAWFPGERTRYLFKKLDN